MSQERLTYDLLTGEIMTGQTLIDARISTMALAKKPGGTICPICDKHVQVYRRKFNSGMALTLMHTFRLFERSPGRYLEVGNYCAKHKGYISGEHAKLVWWGLMEKKDTPSTRGAKSSGLYRITPKGFDFVYGRIRVPSHAIEYLSKPLEWEGSINITEALGNKFSYPELMSENNKEAPKYGQI